MNKDPQSPAVFLNYQAYAVAQKGVIKRFHIYLRSGERYSIPYSLLPIFILISNQELIIKAHELSITITGKGLDQIEDALSTETLLYIKQNPTDKDDGTASVFIQDIQCEGEILMT